MKALLRQILLPLFSMSVLIVHSSTSNARQSASHLSCTDVNLPVALAPSEPPQYQVYGRLCSRDTPAYHSTVQVLVSGGTYSNIYWDFPYQKGRYSYVDALTKAGYSTFSIDRIGIGKSSKPPSEQVNLDSNAYVLYQVNQALHNGTINNTSFTYIIDVGHSFGSIVAVETAARYGGVDGLILSGYLHNLPASTMQSVENEIFYSAQLDPRFAGQDIPDGYLTTIPGIRGQLYYNQSNANPQVIAIDEATKQTVTSGELATGVSPLLFNTSQQIKVPVLLAIGQKDYTLCSDNICDRPENVAEHEKPFFSIEAHLQTYVLPDSGHDMNLHYNADLWYSQARQWSDNIIGTTSKSLTEPAFTGNFLHNDCKLCHLITQTQTQITELKLVSNN